MMKNRKKGFSLVECVVAIAIIMIVTVSAISSYELALLSTRKQWGKYVTMSEADNAFACYQKSEKAEDFEKKMGFSSANKVKEVSRSAQTTTYPTFTQIIAYEEGNGKMELKYNGSTSKMFTYGDRTKYTADKKVLDDLSTDSGIFNKRETKKTSINTTKGASVSYNGTDVSFDWSERVRGYTGDVTTKYSRTFALSSLEQYFLSKDIILGFAPEDGYNDEIFIPSGNKSDGSTGGSFYFYLYSIASSPIAYYKIGSNYAILKVTVAPFTIGSDPKKWTEANSTISVTDVKLGTIGNLSGSTGTIQNNVNNYSALNTYEVFSDFDLPVSFSWYGLPTFAFRCRQMSGTSFDELSPQMDGGTISLSGAVIKTAYVLKTDEYRNIGYGLTKTSGGSETMLFSHQADQILFCHTGGTNVSDLWADFSFEEQSGTKEYRSKQYTKFSPHEESAITVYYSTAVSEGYYCYIKATFSSAPAIQEEIEAWIVTQAQIPDASSEDPVPEDVSEYLSYKKYI